MKRYFQVRRQESLDTLIRSLPQNLRRLALDEWETHFFYSTGLT